MSLFEFGPLEPVNLGRGHAAIPRLSPILSVRFQAAKPASPAGASRLPGRRRRLLARVASEAPLPEPCLAGEFPPLSFDGARRHRHGRRRPRLPPCASGYAPVLDPDCMAVSRMKSRPRSWRCPGTRTGPSSPNCLGMARSILSGVRMPPLASFHRVIRRAETRDRQCRQFHKVSSARRKKAMRSVCRCGHQWLESQRTPIAQPRQARSHWRYGHRLI